MSWQKPADSARLETLWQLTPPYEHLAEMIRHNVGAGQLNLGDADEIVGRLTPLSMLAPSLRC